MRARKVCLEIICVLFLYLFIYFHEYQTVAGILLRLLLLLSPRKASFCSSSICVRVHGKYVWKSFCVLFIYLFSQVPTSGSNDLSMDDLFGISCTETKTNKAEVLCFLSHQSRKFIHILRVRLCQHVSF